ADQAIGLWASLRLQSNVELTKVELTGARTRRRVDLDVKVDGEDTAALGVVSQGEVNCLALSLFLPPGRCFPTALSGSSSSTIRSRRWIRPAWTVWPGCSLRSPERVSSSCSPTTTGCRRRCTACRSLTPRSKSPAGQGR